MKGAYKLQERSRRRNCSHRTRSPRKKNTGSHSSEGERIREDEKWMCFFLIVKVHMYFVQCLLYKVFRPFSCAMQKNKTVYLNFFLYV